MVQVMLAMKPSLASIVKELRLQRPNNLDISFFIVLSWDPEKTSKKLDVESIHWKDMDALVDSASRADLNHCRWWWHFP